MKQGHGRQLATKLKGLTEKKNDDFVRQSKSCRGMLTELQCRTIAEKLISNGLKNPNFFFTFITEICTMLIQNEKCSLRQNANLIVQYAGDVTVVFITALCHSESVLTTEDLKFC
jgi:hypothetical protein